MSAHRSRLLAVVTALLTVGFVASSTGLGAQTPPPTTDDAVRAAYDDAIAATIRETALLQVTGAFGDDVPSAVMRLPETLGLNEIDQTQIADELSTTDTTLGPEALEQLNRLGQAVSPPVAAVLSPTQAVSPIGIAYAPYVRAHYDLVMGRMLFDGEIPDMSGDSAGLLGVFHMLPVKGEVLGNSVARAVEGGEPLDRGDPPDVLIQGDGGEPVADPTPEPVVGPGIVPVSESTLSLDPVEMLILAAVGVMVLGLATLLVTSSQRHGAAHQLEGVRTNRQFMAATRAIHAATSIAELCEAAAVHARLLTDAESATITIDGLEATDGAEFDVPVELVFLANRRERLASEGSMHAIPVKGADNEIIGLLVILGGDEGRLDAVAPLVEDGYASVVAREESAALAFVDGLTGIANRRRFDHDLDAIVSNAFESDTPVAAAMFDVDDFKTFNDTHGHQAGDEVLRQVAELISINLRSTDIVYRYGGEEFVALLPGATVNDAFDVVERIRHIVERASFDGQSCQPGGSVTLSVGVAAAPHGDGRALVRAADMALYEAKTTGRNRVAIESARS